MMKPVIVIRERTYGEFDSVTMLFGPAVIIVGDAAVNDPNFFVINHHPAELVGMVQ